VENYFSYFTEIEEHFQRRRGRIHLSPLDWSLIEVWKDAGIPLAAVLQGVDDAFDRYEQRRSRSQKINSLAYCAQAVMAAAEEMKEAAVGAGAKAERPGGFQTADIAVFLRRNADQLLAAELPQAKGISARPLARETANTLREMASEIEAASKLPRLEDLERRLTVAEEKLFAVLLAATPDEQIIAVRAEADQELAPYRRKMPSSQVEQLQKQYVHKCLLQKYGLPRLSLFYM
jgi:hypothetical protein